MNSTIKRYWIPAALFVAGFALRLMYILESSDNPTFTIPIIDSKTYHQMAIAFAQGQTVESQVYWQPPFYPYFLGVFYWIFGISLKSARFFQALIGSGTVVCIYVLGRRLFNERIGIAAGLLTAIYAPLIFFDAELLSTNIEVFLVPLFLITILTFENRNNFLLLSFAGLILGVLIITRPNFGVLIPLTLIYLVQISWSKNQKQKIVLLLSLFLLCVLLPVLPVTIHNYKASGHFVPVSTNGWINFYIGNNPDAQNTIGARPGWSWLKIAWEPMSIGIESRVDASNHFFQKSKDFVFQQPLQFVSGLFRKSWLFISSREIPRNLDIYCFRHYSEILRIGVWRFGGFGFPAGIMLPFAAIGFVVSLFRKRRNWFVHSFLFFYAGSVILFFVSARYRIPLIPILLIFSVFGITWSLEKIRSQQISTKLSLFILIPALFFVVNLPRSATSDVVNFAAEMESEIGKQYLFWEDLQQAEEHFSRSLKIEPNDSVRAHLALCYYYSNRVEKAEKIWREIITSSHSVPIPYLGLGMIAYHRNDLAGAEQLLSRAKELAPGLDDVSFYLGMTLAGLGKLEEARNELLLIKKLPGVKTHLGVLAVKLGRYQEAESYFEEAVTESPNNAFTLNDFAWFLAVGPDKNPERAVDLAQKACVLTDFSNAHTLDTLATALAANGKFREAVDYVKKAIKLAAPDEREEFESHLKLFESEQQVNLTE